MRAAELSAPLIAAIAAWALLGGCGSSGGGGGQVAADATGDAAVADTVVGDSADGADAGGGDAKADGTSDANSDAGADATPACSVPEVGECKGSTVRWCDEGALRSYDCTEDDPGSVCRQIDADYGFDCALPKDVTCTYLDENDEAQWLFCQGKGAGCVVSDAAAEGVCKDGVGACTDDDIGACKGDNLVLDCLGGQPLALACKGVGAGCGEVADLGSACTGAVKGAYCDDAVVVCAKGLSCAIDAETEVGVCQ